MHGQVSSVPRFQLGLSGGAFIYQGDLTPSALGSYRTPGPAVQLFASKFFSRSLSARAQLAFGGLRGDDAAYGKPAYRQERNFAFHSPVLEISVQAEWNPLGTNYITRGFAPYLFAGLGYGFLHIRRDWSRFNTEYFGSTEADLLARLNEDISHALPAGAKVVPVGVGLRYYFSDRLGVSAETSYRLMGTDYLDGFSRAANPSLNDHYYSHTIGIVYRIGKKNTLGCPVMQY